MTVDAAVCCGVQQVVEEWALLAGDLNAAACAAAAAVAEPAVALSYPAHSHLVAQLMSKQGSFAHVQLCMLQHALLMLQAAQKVVVLVIAMIQFVHVLVVLGSAHTSLRQRM